MDQGKFETLVDDFGASARDLVDLVEHARYEQPTAVAIARLLDAREQLLALIARLAALRAAAAPDDAPALPADLPERIAQARVALKSSSDSTTILQLTAEVAALFAAIVAPLQAAGRWPRGRAR